VRFVRRVALVAVVATAVTVAAPAHAVSVPWPSDPDPVVALEKTGSQPSAASMAWAARILNGGLVLHMRHGKRNQGHDVEMFDSMELEAGVDGATTGFADKVCLNDGGVSQVQELAKQIRRIGLRASQVVSSPVCRARQTAFLAWGRVDTVDNMLLYDSLGTDKEIEDRATALRNFVNNVPLVPNSSVILVGHTNTWSNARIVPIASGVVPNVNEGGLVVLDKVGGSMRVSYVYPSFEDLVAAHDAVLARSAVPRISGWTPRASASPSTAERRRAVRLLRKELRTDSERWASAAVAWGLMGTQVSKGADSIAVASFTMHHLSQRALALAAAADQTMTAKHLQRLSRERQNLLLQANQAKSAMPQLR
jgi:phosphohistidine phosphatase SixA